MWASVTVNKREKSWKSEPERIISIRSRGSSHKNFDDDMCVTWTESLVNANNVE